MVSGSEPASAFMLSLLQTTMLLHNWFHSNMWLGLALNLPCMNDKGNSCSYSCLIEWVNRSMVKTTRIPVIFITILLYMEQLHCQKSIHLPETDGWVGKNNDQHFYTLLKSIIFGCRVCDQSYVKQVLFSDASELSWHKP